MPSPRAGPPDDDLRFAGAGLERLRAAAAHAAWLVDRGYPPAQVIELAGNRHDLDARQRHALHRTLCTAQVARARQALRLRDVRGQVLHVDGFNLLVTLEVGLAGGVLVRGRDGMLRDLAGVRGSYAFVTESPEALARLARVIGRLRVAGLHWVLDAPVAWSGELAHRLRDTPWPCPCTVELAPDADRLLAGLPAVVSSDGAVLDRCASWLDLAGRALRGAPLRIVAPFARRGRS